MRRLVRWREESGASSIELVVFFPLMLLVVLMTLEVGLSWYGREVAVTVARETVRDLRTGAHDPQALSAAEAHGRQYAATTAAGGLRNVEVVAEVVGQDVVVTVSGDPMDVVGLLSRRTEVTVTSPIESFREAR